MISLRYWSNYLAIILVVNSLYEYCSSRSIVVSANFIESFNCSDSIYNVVDLAKISFKIPSTLSNKDLSLYAINSRCYRCSKTLVAKGLSSGVSSCATMYTPHMWHLFLVDSSSSSKEIMIHLNNLYSHTTTTSSDTGFNKDDRYRAASESNVISVASYTFGDHGEYDIYPNADLSIKIAETKRPRDVMLPLYVLFGVICAIAIVSFCGPSVVQYVVSKRRSKSNNSSEDIAIPFLTQHNDFNDPVMPVINYNINTSYASNGRSTAARHTVGATTTTTPLHHHHHHHHPPPTQPHRSERLQSLDSFRGFSLCLMIFVNYGGGGYWFFDHAEWNGLTVADLLFPWFMWIMGVSMAMSFVSILKATRSAVTTITTTDHRSYSSSSSRPIDENDPAASDSGVFSSGSHRLSSTGNSEHHTHSLVSSTSNPLPEYNPQGTIHPSTTSVLYQGFHSIGTSNAHTTTTTTTSQTLPYTLLGINSDVWLKVFRRSLLLFLIGMFLANGHKYQTWRVPGVLQYFAVSYLITGITVLSVHTLTKKRLDYLIIDTTSTTNAKESEKSEHNNRPSNNNNDDDEDHSSSSNTNNRETNWFFPQDQEGNSTVWQKWEGYCLSAKGLVLNHGGILPMTSRHWMYALWKKWNVLTVYCYEWIIQLSLLILYLSIVYGVKAPNCPVGYVGPGGISDDSRYEGCTGGIHRYIDMKVFSYTHIYHHPTCLEMYQCQAYDPEGLLGSISACTLTYSGLMAGRVVVHFKDHNDRLIAWFIGGLVMLLLSGILCGFSREEGLIPINKNLWSTSFVLINAGSGMILLSIFYLFIDVYKVWSGAPYRYLGMNSILIYFGHSVFAGYFPFSFLVYDANHGTLLAMNIVGVVSWIAIAYYLYKINFFVKI